MKHSKYVLDFVVDGGMTLVSVDLRLKAISHELYFVWAHDVIYRVRFVPI